MKNFVFLTFICNLTIFIIISSCKKEKIPSISTLEITDITATTATCGGTITDEGSAKVVERGICWSKNLLPTIAGTRTIDGDGAGIFKSNLNGLTVGTPYNVRAYATNSVGTAYGTVVSFTTLGQVTLAATRITATSSTLNGIVNANNLSTIASFEYGLTTSYGSTVEAIPNPVTGNIIINVSADIVTLTERTKYHFRVKAVNSLGTFYGDDMTFITEATVSDVDGNVYNTITIGKQVWMEENLKTTKYNDGTAIPNVTEAEWLQLSSGAYCDYDNIPVNSTTYGRLYNWYVGAATNTRNVCPTGWHVPNDTEWQTLVNYLGGENVAGDKLKEAGNTHWDNPNTATNETGFTALPGGCRYNGALFSTIGGSGYWWSATDSDTNYALSFNMYFMNSDVFKQNDPKNFGYSIRCISNLIIP